MAPVQLLSSLLAFSYHLMAFCCSKLVSEISAMFPSYVGNISFSVAPTLTFIKSNYCMNNNRGSCSASDVQVDAASIPGPLPLSILVVACLTRVANFKCREQESNLCTFIFRCVFPVLHTLMILMFIACKFFIGEITVVMQITTDI